MHKKTIRSGYLPPLWLQSQSAGNITWKPLPFNRGNRSLIVEVPDLTSSQADSLSQFIKVHGLRAWKDISLKEIIKGISNVALLLLDKNNSSRIFLNDNLEVVTGFDRKMIELNLSSYLKTFREHSLKSFLTQDFNQVESRTPMGFPTRF